MHSIKILFYPKFWRNFDAAGTVTKSVLGLICTNLRAVGFANMLKGSCKIQFLYIQINENIAGGITLPFAFFNGKTKIQTFGR